MTITGSIQVPPQQNALQATHAPNGIINACRNLKSELTFTRCATLGIVILYSCAIAIFFTDRLKNIDKVIILSAIAPVGYLLSMGIVMSLARKRLNLTKSQASGE